MLLLSNFSCRIPSLFSKCFFHKRKLNIAKMITLITKDLTPILTVASFTRNNAIVAIPKMEKFLKNENSFMFFTALKLSALMCNIENGRSAKTI